MTARFSPAARDDLFEIAGFIAQDNPARALTFIDDLEAKCEALALSPGIGTQRPELGPGIRMLPHRRYLIFYREEAKHVRIERILHGSRDINDDDLAQARPQR